MHPMKTGLTHTLSYTPLPTRMQNQNTHKRMSNTNTHKTVNTLTQTCLYG